MKINSHILLFFLVSLSTLGRCIVLYRERLSIEIIGWIFFGSVILWNIRAFMHDKDMLGVGPYSYKNGINQTGRGIYLYAVTSVFVIASIHG